MTAPVAVLAVRPINKGALKAVVTLRVGAFTIYGVKVLQPDGGEAYMALPQMPIRRNGTGWTAAVSIDDQELFAQIRTAVVEAWQSRADAS